MDSINLIELKKDYYEYMSLKDIFIKYTINDYYWDIIKKKMNLSRDKPSKIKRLFKLNNLEEPPSIKQETSLLDKRTLPKTINKQISKQIKDEGLDIIKEEDDNIGGLNEIKNNLLERSKRNIAKFKK